MISENLKLIKKIRHLKKNKKKIVLCHGVFDLVHLGHIEHFKSAKNFGEFLYSKKSSDMGTSKLPVLNWSTMLNIHSLLIINV